MKKGLERTRTYRLAPWVEPHIINTSLVSCQFCTISCRNIPDCHAVIFVAATSRDPLALLVPTRLEQILFKTLLCTFVRSNCSVGWSKWPDIPGPNSVVV